jgi:hypothetical protein
MSYSKIASEIVRQKERLWRKVLSQSAIEENLYSLIDVKEQLDLRYDLSVFDSVFSSIIPALGFGIPFKDIPTFSLCWNVELPRPEDFAKGISLNIFQTSIFEKYPDISIFMEDLRQYISTHFAPQIAEEVLEKAYYGISRYGYAYFDPRPVRDFLRSTMIKEAKRSISPGALAAIYKSFSKALGIDIGVLNRIFMSFVAMDRAKYTPAISNYAWSDFTLAEEESQGKVKVTTEDLDGKKIDLYVRGLGDLWLGVYALLTGMDVEPFLEKGLPEVENVPDVSKRVEYAIADRISREQRSRVTMTSLLVSNYQRADEKSRAQASMRTEIWGYSRGMYYELKRAVEREVEKMISNLPRFVKNQYNVAVQQLYSRLTRDGGWGYEAYRSMTLSQLKVQWTEEWTLKGLDREVLEKLFDKALTWIERLAHQRSAAKLSLMSRFM